MQLSIPASPEGSQARRAGPDGNRPGAELESRRSGPTMDRDGPIGQRPAEGHGLARDRTGARRERGRPSGGRSTKEPEHGNEWRRESRPGATIRTESVRRTVRHALRDQEILWAEFLDMARVVVDSLAKSVDAICDGRLELIPEIKSVEEESDREEVRIEQECLRILALYEPVASDLRRLATILKVNRDWERIADLAARIARRVAQAGPEVRRGVPIPEPLKAIARDVLWLVRDSYDALAGRDSGRARAVIEGDRVDRPAVPSVPQGAQGGPPPRCRPARGLAPVDEHRA